MKLTILAFGIAKDIIGKEKLRLNVDEKTTVKELKDILCSKYARLSSLPSFLLAVNSSYAKDSLKLQQNDKIAIIPPTNGG